MTPIDKDELLKHAYKSGDWDRGEHPMVVDAEDIENAPTVDQWYYPSKGEIPDKDWSKHPANISKECFVVTKRGVGTIARWDNDYRMWFERPRLAVIDVIAWQYFVPPKEIV